MKIPCKNCPVLIMCKNRVKEYKSFYHTISTFLYEDCSLFKDYYNFYMSQTGNFFDKFEETTEKAFCGGGGENW